MNFATLAKFHHKAFGRASPVSLTGSGSAASSPMTLHFGELEMDDSNSTASASPEFERRQLESDSDSDASSSGLRTPEGSPPSSRTLAPAATSTSKDTQAQAVLVQGEWSPESTSDEGSANSEEDDEPPFSLSLPSPSPLQAARPPGLPLPSHLVTPIKKLNAAPGFKKSPSKGVPLAHTPTSLPKSRVKKDHLAGPRSAPTAREAEESRRGRSRWVCYSLPDFESFRMPPVSGCGHNPTDPVWDVSPCASLRHRPLRSQHRIHSETDPTSSPARLFTAPPALALRDRLGLARRSAAVPRPRCRPAPSQARVYQYSRCGRSVVAQDGARGPLNLGALAHTWRLVVL